MYVTLNMTPYFASALCLIVIAALRVHAVGGHPEVNPLSNLKHSKVKVELGITFACRNTC